MSEENQLPLHLKRAILAVHLVLACLWVGGIASMLLIEMSKSPGAQAAELALRDRTMVLLHDRLVTHASFGFLLTGLAFSACTAWGFTRWPWIAAKWGLTLALGICAPLLISPELNSMAAMSDIMDASSSSDPAYAEARDRVAVGLAIELAALACIILLSAFRPGRARANPRRLLSFRARAIAGGTTISLLAAGYSAQQWALAVARDRPVQARDPLVMVTGTYCGSAVVGGFRHAVRVRIESGRITEVLVTRNRPTLYARLAERVAAKVILANKVDVDAVAGATTGSLALRSAIADALARDPSVDGQCP